jgi:hypothetical protein
MKDHAKTRGASYVKRRLAVWVLALGVLVFGVATPLVAGLTGQQSYFGCGDPGELIVDVPNDAFFSQTVHWWLPEIYYWDAGSQSWLLAGHGDWHYAYTSDPAVISMVNYQSGQSENFNRVPVTQGYYYAVLNWFWEGGAWVSQWARDLNSNEFWCFAP